MKKVIIENLSKIYKGKKILKNISLQLSPGKVYGIIGENGAGKTTLMKIVCGLTSCDEGKCEVSEHCVGALIEEPAFYKIWKHVVWKQ